MKFEINVAGAKQTVEVGSVAVQTSVTLPITITPIVPPPPSSLNLLDYGAIPDGRTDCQAAIVKALADARARKLSLYVPPGRYLHSSTVDIDSVVVFGDGITSEFVSNNPIRAAIFLKGSGPVLSNVKHTINNGTWGRQSTAEQASICIWQATGAVVEKVTCEGGTSIGVLAYGAVSAVVKNCSVRKTLADSYHVTFGSQGVTLSNNFARECGDDGIAVVSYGGNPRPCSGVLILGNDVGHNTHGRGITCVGGNDIRIEWNTVTRSSGAGILIASEPSPWNTYPVNNVTCLKNNLFECVTNLTIGHPAVLIAGRSGFPVSNVLVESTTIVNPRNDGFRFDQFLDRITVKSSTISGIRSGYKAFNVNSSSVNNVSIQ